MQETANPIALRYRRMILDAFAALTRTTPYGEITILRIVQEADVSRQTFYRHFRSKDEILAATLQRIADGVTERLQSLQQPAGPRRRVCILFPAWEAPTRYILNCLRSPCSPKLMMIPWRALCAKNLASAV